MVQIAMIMVQIAMGMVQIAAWVQVSCCVYNTVRDIE